MPERSLKSPFPGMDPYLEKHWQDVHQALCTYARDKIQSELTGDLVARLGERLVVETNLGAQRSIYPDVRIVKHALADVGVSSNLMGAVAVAEPLVIRIGSDPMPQSFIEIIEPDSGVVVTVIEFISPSNKLPGSGRRQYLQKQEELVGSSISLVEIDLIRSGESCVAIPTVQIPENKRATYMICVYRAGHRDQFEVYPAPLRDILPAIRIPLREGEKDIVLNIQALIDQAYINGRYNRTDYRQPCIPPLEGEDAAWARELLSNRGLV